jgi:hypothetical protein
MRVLGYPAGSKLRAIAYATLTRTTQPTQVLYLISPTYLPGYFLYILNSKLKTLNFPLTPHSPLSLFLPVLKLLSLMRWVRWVWKGTFETLLAMPFHSLPGGRKP